MKAYRLAHKLFIAKLNHPLVFEAKRGRWNTEGWSIAYMSEHPALAALEMLGYWDIYESMIGYHLFTTDIPSELIEDAQHIDPNDEKITRAFGDQWLREQRSLVLRVQSVTVPASFNLLVNSAHPALDQLTVTDLGDFTYDSRIYQLIETAKT